MSIGVFNVLNPTPTPKVVNYVCTYTLTESEIFSMIVKLMVWIRYAMIWLRGTSVSDSYNLTELSNLFTVLILYSLHEVAERAS